MFSGIIQEIGSVKKIVNNDTDIDIFIESSLVIKNLCIGSSIAINGICMTVRDIVNASFTVSACLETIKKTSLCQLKLDSMVNLENSLTLNSFMDGHIVQGHITCTTNIIDIEQQGDSRYFTFAINDEISKYIVHKGCIAIDGISLTVCNKDSNGFSVAAIPHTIEHTIIKTYTVGSIVNIEVDILGRYIESLMSKRPHE